VLFLAVIAGAVQLIAGLEPGMGFHGQELTTIACGQKLSWGAMDGPQLAAWLARLMTDAFGVSVVGVRIVPALAASLTVWLAGRMARQAGGGAVAGFLAASATLCAPGVLMQHGALTAGSLELLFLTLAASLVLRRLAAGGAQSWLLPGLVLGLALQAKLTAWWFVLGLGLGLALTDMRRLPGLLRGALVTGAVVAPFLVWQAAEGWPVWDYLWAEHVLNRGLLTVPDYVWRFVLLAQPMALPVWGAGLLWLLFSREAGRMRPLLGFVALPLVAFLVSSSGRPDRLLPLLPLLFAMGGVAVERVFRGRITTVATYGSLILVCGAWTAPLAIPILAPGPAQAWAERTDFLGYRKFLTRNMLARLGWAEMTAAVMQVVDGLEPHEREAAVVLALTGGEAGALILLGRDMDMPPVYCAQNALFERPPAEGEGQVAVALAWPLHRLHDLYADVRQVGVHQPVLADPQEMGLPIYVCRQARVPLAEAWPQLRSMEAARDLD
jgi:4-amino-4-deoxy-L-arabinose transferase-like glycosyltransferase